MLYNYQLQERLDVDYACDACHSKGTTFKADSIASTSEVPIVTLKAFEFNTSTLSTTKKKFSLTVEEELNVCGKWRLAGMVLLEGDSANSGHYTSFVKPVPNAKTCSWYNINDSIVTTCCAPLHFSPSDHSLPYILFYVKVNERDASLSQEQRQKAFSRIESVTNEQSNTTTNPLGVNAVLKELFHQTKKVFAAKRKASGSVQGVTVPPAKQFKGKRRKLFTQSDKDRVSRQRKTMSQERKDEQRQRDSVRKSKNRAFMNEERKDEQWQRDSVRKSEKRASMNEERKDEERQRDSVRKSENRASMNEERKEKERNCGRTRKVTTRATVYANKQHSMVDPAILHTKAYLQVKKDFDSVVHEGPTFICDVCWKIEYKSRVLQLKQHKYDTDIFTSCHTNKSSWICTSCHKQMLKRKMPAAAYNNNMQLCPIVEELEELCDIELILTDKSALRKQYVRPAKVNAALQKLCEINPLYKGVSIDSDWAEVTEASDPELWNLLTSQDTIDTEEQPCSDEENFDAEGNDRMEKASLASLPTVMSNVTGPALSTSDVINVAPGEGQIPISIENEPDWEALAFPKEFSTGSNHFSSVRRVSISMIKCFHARLKCCDGRFASNYQYIFNTLHLIEARAVASTITIAQRKSYQGDISASKLINKDGITNLLTEDQIFAQFKNIRGTPQYFQNMAYDVLAKIRQFGNYTFFLTVSAAEFHWPHIIQIVARQYGEELTVEQVENMDFSTKVKYFKRNPVTVARHIDYIFQQLWGKVILGGLHPIGHILNYDDRREFQGAPQLDKSPIEEVTAFIDQYITCSLPDIILYPDLHNL
ncbi:hypothetical protein Ahia01_000375800, partial [Argonauta hians]